MNKKIFIYIIFVLAFLERTVFDFGANVELVTLAMLLASVYLSRNTALKLTFLLMVATDLVIGNTRIFLFTWSAFLLPILLFSKSIFHRQPSILKFTSYGIFSNLFFYLWSNFGVWLLDSWNMYPKTLPGLLHCYYMGLPFLRLHLASTLLFIPLGFIAFNWVLRLKSHLVIMFDTSR